ncbi:OmpA family protein [Aquicoccus porphyridii]|uniref:OmpA family protein n=1 Tax=Aquicoccus porphyridii TaxID=1852029 RepID=A0A5A9ZUB8_9RHOB|nr:OmpA family protein [Aquicoccus porphyridii]KAA0920691.1 OmpA family protein [Aquicoccus porphyridii]RAI56757.1 OmpA family protein [Rhodobacteraceae bacterium AsT-22]
MKQNSLRSTTAIVVVLSLIQPVPVLAQSGQGQQSSEVGDQRGMRWLNQMAASRAPEEICAEAGITDGQACGLFIEELEAAAESGDAIELAPGLATEAHAQDTLRAEEAAEAEAQVEAEAEAEAEAEVAAEAEAEAESQAEEEAEAAAEAEAKAEDEAEAQAAEEAEAKVEAEAEAQAEADEAARAAAEADADAAAQAAADALAEEAAAATMAGAEAETGTPDEVTSEVLTEQTSRSSSEEFRDESQAEQSDPAPDTDGEAPEASATADSGMSDLERAGLLALGAVVVGALLSNGQRVASRTGDRVIVVDDDGAYSVLKDDDALLRTPGSEVRTERFADGSTRTVVTRDDGTTIVTVRDANGRALRRMRVEPDGREYLLIDDTRDVQPVIIRDLPPPIRQTVDYQTATDRDTLRQALLAADERDIGRSFSLRQVRDIVQVRELAPEINLGGITFETDSSAIPPAQAEQLRKMGLLMRDLIRDEPTELFLVEGHTDAIGSQGHNLLLSDRRAESVARAFGEYFGVKAENIIVQGYGESFLKIPTQTAERQNRRVAVRRITALVQPY